jgi:hypothetical protein
MTSPYSHVPDAEPDSEPDPHWLELRRTPWRLPEAYMPPVMAGPKPRWARAAAWVLVALFLTATTCGVCLTYGPNA